MPLRLLAVSLLVFGTLVVMPALAAGAEGDRDPVDVFDHLAEQRNELGSDIAEAGAELVGTPSGGFEVRSPDIGSDTWHNGAQRPLSPSAVSFDPSDGSISFSFVEHGTVRFEPTNRDAPSLQSHPRDHAVRDCRE